MQTSVMFQPAPIRVLAAEQIFSSFTCLQPLTNDSRLARIPPQNSIVIQPFSRPAVSKARVAGEHLPLFGCAVMTVQTLKQMMELPTSSRIMKVKSGKAAMLTDADFVDMNDDCEFRVIRPTVAS